jgi:hypothetical protein
MSRAAAVVGRLVQVQALQGIGKVRVGFDGLIGTSSLFDELAGSWIIISSLSAARDATMKLFP